ncbi:MAG: tetratricopeptide repeat protein, partial [Mesorhizobium sp.]|nr:tetratricopeptide repeat protein [Mesorhizobium sp.]
MRMKKRNWPASVALAIGLGFSAVANAAATPPELTSFSGAYLAGRAAEADNDLDSAISYYRRALAVSPDNQALQQSIMLALVAKGSFDEALPYAEKLKSVADVERFSRVALAIDAFRKDKFTDAETFLKLALESDLDRLITGVMTAWAKAGSGDSAGAMTVLDRLDGPEWYSLFRNIHRALILDFAGRKEDARAVYDETAITRSAADVAPEAYVRLVEAYAGFLARDGKKDEALQMLDRVNEFSTGRPTTAALRKDIQAGKPIPMFIATAREGAAEILLDVASALNRGGGESFVRIYLQFARALTPANDAVLIQLGGVAEQQQNLEEAIEIYGKVSADSPLKRIAELQMGLDLAELKRTDEAVSHLKALLDQDPDDMRAYLALGGVYAGVEDFRAAAQVYDRAVERLKAPTKGEWSVFYQRGIAYERLKEWP